MPCPSGRASSSRASAERIKTYGRAFGDPEKGAPGQALSSMQGRKLKEITAKAKGEEPKRRWGRRKISLGRSLIVRLSC